MVTRNELAQSIGYRENGAYSQTLKLVKQDLTHNDMKYEKEFLDYLTFNDSRFTLDPSKEARAFNVRLHHENEDVYLRCQFTLNDTYSFVYSLAANITYIGIEENILKLYESLGKSKIPKKFRRNHASTFVYLFPEYYPYPSQPYYFPPEKVNNKDEIIRMAEKCNQFWRESAKPFFDKFQDFRNILPFIESFEIKEYRKFIRPGSCTERKLILWRLCNHPRLDEFYDYSMDELNSLQAINPDPDIKRRITILNECGLLIKRIEPMYDWDQNYLIPKTAPVTNLTEVNNNAFSAEPQVQNRQTIKAIKYMNSNKKFDDFLEDILWEMSNKGWKVSEMEGYSFEREYIELRIKDVVIFFVEEFSSEMNYEGILVSRVYHQLYNKLLEIKIVITDPIRTFSMGSINTQIATSLGYDKPELEIEIPIIDADYEVFREKLLEYFDRLYKTFDTKWMSLPMFLQNIVDVPLSKLDKEYTVGYMYKVISSSILDDERLENFKQEAKDYVEQIGNGKLDEYQMILKTLNI